MSAIAIVILALSSAPAAGSGEKLFQQKQAAFRKNLTERIDILSNAKSCVDNSKKALDLKACQQQLSKKMSDWASRNKK